MDVSVAGREYGRDGTRRSHPDRIARPLKVEADRWGRRHPRLRVRHRDGGTEGDFGELVTWWKGSDLRGIEDTQ